MIAPRPKRRRSVLRDQSSETSLGPIPGTQEEPTQKPSSGAARGVSTEPKRIKTTLALRGHKKSYQRESETDIAVTLSKTDHFIVSQLPNLPDQIRALQSEPFKCFFDSEGGYALALTNSRAIIWTYARENSGLGSTDTLNLTIPEFARDSAGNVPLGALLSTVAAGFPGLFIIAPSTGKIVYWETVPSANLGGLSTQKQSGLHGAVSGLFSGEVVVDVLNAEPSGVIVTLSSGRVVHVTLRDSQGQPHLNATFLRSSSRIGAGGLFSGIRNVLSGGSLRKDIVSIKAGISRQRGQRDILIATANGLVEIWDTHWNHGSVLRSQFDLKSATWDSFGSRAEDPAGTEHPRLWDFVWTSSRAVNSDDSHDTADDPYLFWFLVSLRRNSNTRSFAIINAALVDNTPSIICSHDVDLDNISLDWTGTKPRLYIPQPVDVAFIVFGQRLILLSLKRYETAATQLLSDANLSHLPYQDSIYFREEEDCEVMCAGYESRSNDLSFPTCLLMVRRFGIVRVAALPRKKGETGFEDFHISAKSKLEQAIFFGSKSTNPLNLLKNGDFAFSHEEIQQAALEICNELLQSTSEFIPTSAISISQNLWLRLKALEDLATFLMQRGFKMDRESRWELLWGAEKLSAQVAMWRLEENLRKTKDAETTFLSQVIQSMSDKYKTHSNIVTSEQIQQWMLHDSYRIECIIPWIFNTIKAQKGTSASVGRKIIDRVLEASELSLAILETAFQYRNDHFTMFGLGNDLFDDGVLNTGYEDLPEFWTSREIGFVETAHLLDLELDVCRARVQRTSSTADVSEDEPVGQIARNSARHLRVLNQIQHERVRWLSAQGNDKILDEATNIDQTQARQRKWRLFKLAGVGQLQEAISLAEEFKDMDALVELIVELQDQINQKGGKRIAQRETPDVVERELGETGRRISRYFEKFGEPWAEAFLMRQITMGQSGVLLALRKFRPFVTRFLRKNSIYARLGWMNDILGERDYDAASRSLQTLATQFESDVWSHRVELSLAKLSKLAMYEQDQVGTIPSAASAEIKLAESQIETDYVQELVYGYISPALEGAIDEKAEVELAMDYVGKSVAEDRPSLHEILNDILAMVVKRQVLEVEQLIDLLTLMDLHQPAEHDVTAATLQDNVFYYALRILRLSSFAEKDPSYCSALQKLVWKRCMIHDDWAAIGKPIDQLNYSDGLSIHRTMLFRTMTLCCDEEDEHGVDRFSLYQPISPIDILQASNSDLLVGRFRTEQRPRVLRDLAREDEVLRQLVEPARLDLWFQDIVAACTTSKSQRASSLSHDKKTELTDLLVNQQGDTPAKARLSWL